MTLRTQTPMWVQTALLLLAAGCEADQDCNLAGCPPALRVEGNFHAHPLPLGHIDGELCSGGACIALESEGDPFPANRVTLHGTAYTWLTLTTTSEDSLRLVGSSGLEADTGEVIRLELREADSGTVLLDYSHVATSEATTGPCRPRCRWVSVCFQPETPGSEVVVHCTSK